MPNSLKDRINLRLEKLGKSAREASMEALGKPDPVRDIRAGRILNPGIDTMLAIAGALETSLEWLWTGRGEEEQGRREPAITRQDVYNVAVALYRARAADTMTETEFANHAVILCEMSAQDAETDLPSAIAYELRRQKTPS